LLATQGIRGGANRRLLERIRQSGDIFFAESDRNWVLDGANVHVSMVGFDDGTQVERVLDGQVVQTINSNLTNRSDTTSAKALRENAGMCIIGTQKNGAFEAPIDLAKLWLGLPLNPHGRPNSDVVLPWSNGADVTQGPSNRWIVDFGVSRSESAAALYQAPFEHLLARVKPERQRNRREAYRLRWWLHAEPRRAMRDATTTLSRFVATPVLSKHRLFVWMGIPTLADKQLAVLARSDDYFFGVVHSRVHEEWARATGTQLREAESGFRYTPTTCFETFPFPSPTDVQREAIAAAARELDALRSRWLNPPEWVKEDVLEFPASVDGPWARLVRDPNTGGIGTARYVRLVPVDEKAGQALKKRTLTNLYNERPTWLANAHRTLDEAVFAAYGWPPSLTDDELLAKLLELNLAMSAADASGSATLTT
jgi:type II restriction/modification system DNA methylase subunit YeeA